MRTASSAPSRPSRLAPLVRSMRWSTPIAWATGSAASTSSSGTSLVCRALRAAASCSRAALASWTGSDMISDLEEEAAGSGSDPAYPKRDRERNRAASSRGPAGTPSISPRSSSIAPSPVRTSTRSPSDDALPRRERARRSVGPGRPGARSRAPRRSRSTRRARARARGRGGAHARSASSSGWRRPRRRGRAPASPAPDPAACPRTLSPRAKRATVARSSAQARPIEGAREQPRVPRRIDAQPLLRRGSRRCRTPPRCGAR